MSTIKSARLALLACLVAGPSPGWAAQDCPGLGWSVDNERGWFSDPRLPRRESGARMGKIDRAVDLQLQPTSKIHFFLVPERKPKPDSYSGQVTFLGVPKPGVYQVTVSQDAYIDVFENGVRLKLMAEASSGDCDGIAKSARFNLAPGDLVLVEVSGVASKSLKVAFSEAP